MNLVRRIGRLAAGVLLMLHGIAHAPGALGSLKLATFDDVSFQPDLLPGAGDGLVMLLGVIWVLAAAAFVVAGIGLILRWSRATVAVLGAIALSLPLTVLWYQDAVAGLILNGAILFVFLVRAGLGGEVTRRNVAVPRVQ
jgi:hypothetical protein